MPREEIRFVRPLNSLFARSSSALQTTLVVGMFGVTAVMPNIFTRNATATPVAPVQDPNSEPGQDPADEPTEEPGQDPADEPMNSDPGDPADDPIEDPADEPVEEPAAPAPKKPAAPAPKKPAAPAPKKQDAPAPKKQDAPAPKKSVAPAPKKPAPAPKKPAPAPEETEPADVEPAADDVPVTVDTEQIRDAAQAAMKKGEWSQAANGWATLLQFLPGDEEATRERTRAQSMLEGGTVIGSVSSDREVRRQQATAQFSSDMKRSQSLLAQQDYDQAKLAAVTARTRLDLARNVLNAAEFEQMSADAEKLVDQIGEESRQHKLTVDQKARTTQGEQSASSQRTEAENRTKRVNEILLNVRKLQMQQKYTEALQVLDSALALDPNNSAALTLRDALHTTEMYVRFAETQKRRSYGFSRLEDEALEATVPQRVNVSGPGPRSTNALVTYPEDWQELSDRRVREPDYGASGYREAEVNVPTWNKIQTTSIPVPFTTGPTLEQACDYFKHQTKVDFLINWTQLKEVGLEPEQTAVTIDLGSTNMESAIKRVLERVISKNGDQPPSEPLAFDVQDGIVVITTKAGVQKKQVTFVYDVRDLLFRAPDFDNAPEFNLSQSVQTGGGGGGGGKCFAFERGDCTRGATCRFSH